MHFLNKWSKVRKFFKEHFSNKKKSVKKCRKKCKKKCNKDVKKSIKSVSLTSTLFDKFGKYSG